MADTLLETYSPDLVLVSFAGIPITGFADGTFIEVERSEDAFTDKVGSLGDMVRTVNLNKSGKATCTVLAQHPVNSLLMAQFLLDESTRSAPGPFLMKDLSGTTICDAPVSWITRPPKADRAKESGNVVWVIRCSNLTINIGGNLLTI